VAYLSANGTASLIVCCRAAKVWLRPSFGPSRIPNRAAQIGSAKHVNPQPIAFGICSQVSVVSFDREHWCLKTESLHWFEDDDVRVCKGAALQNRAFAITNGFPTAVSDSI
jgi:hypothetical protein